MNGDRDVKQIQGPPAAASFNESQPQCKDILQPPTLRAREFDCYSFGKELLYTEKAKYAWLERHCVSAAIAVS